MILEHFAYFYHSRTWHMVNIDENILESSGTNFMNLPPYVFDVDYVAKIRSELSITVIEKMNEIPVFRESEQVVIG